MVKKVLWSYREGEQFAFLTDLTACQFDACESLSVSGKEGESSKLESSGNGAEPNWWEI